MKYAIKHQSERCGHCFRLSVDSRRNSPLIRCGQLSAARFAFAVALWGAATVAWAAPLSANEINVLRERDTRSTSVTPSQAALELARRIGREANADGLRAIVELRNVVLLQNALQSYDPGPARQLPEALETLIVANYADAQLQRPLLALIGMRSDELGRFPQYRSRQLFELLHADLKKANTDRLHLANRIVASDLQGIEPELIALLPALDSASANEIVMLLGQREFAAAVPALIALQARTPFANDVNGLLQHINGALLQIGTPPARQAVLDRMRALGRQGADARAGNEIWTILSNLARLPAGRQPDYAEIRAALPAELNQTAWAELVRLIVARKEIRGIPDLIRALGQAPVADAAVNALLAIGEPSDWQAARAALPVTSGTPGALQKRLDEAITDPPKWLARRNQIEREQALQLSERQYGTEKNRLAAYRTTEPQRYADGLRAVIERREALLRDYADLPFAVGARQQLLREYMYLAAFQRFQLRQPDAAIAAYQAAARLQPAASLDRTALAIADVQRFDKRDVPKAIAQYRLALAGISQVSAAPNPPQWLPMLLGLRRWIEREIDSLQSGKPFAGTIGREDLATAQVWMLLLSDMQGEMSPSVQEAMDVGRMAAMQGLRVPVPAAASGLQSGLNALPASQFQLAAAFVAAWQLPPADMLRFFARHDPAGYLTASLLALATYRPPGAGERGGHFDLDPAKYGAQDAVKSAADSFFRSHRIRTALAGDSRYASAEKTWALFLDSAKKGDATAMLACFTPAMRAKLQELFSKMSREDLRKMGESFVRFSIDKAGSADSREAVVQRQSGDRSTAGFIYFANDGGDWKIDSM